MLSAFAKPLNRKTFPYLIATSYFQVLFGNKFDSNSNSLKKKFFLKKFIAKKTQKKREFKPKFSSFGMQPNQVTSFRLFIGLNYFQMYK